MEKLKAGHKFVTVKNRFPLMNEGNGYISVDGGIFTCEQQARQYQAMLLKERPTRIEQHRTKEQIEKDNQELLALFNPK